MKTLRRTSYLALVFALSFAGTGTHAAPFQRGDANADWRYDMSDAMFTLRLLFDASALGPNVARRCDDAADTNDDGFVELSDAVLTLNHLFLGGRPPRTPGRVCGEDPTADALGCEEFAPCSVMTSALRAAEDCDDTLADLRAALIEDMESRLDENERRALDLVGRKVWCLPRPVLAANAGPVAAVARTVAPVPETDAAEEFSETNNQTAGVDEADFVKNDGTYIYILADGKFQIVDAWPPQTAEKLAAVEIDGTPKKLFVHNDRAVVYSSLDFVERPWDVVEPGAGGGAIAAPILPGPLPRPGPLPLPRPIVTQEECTYGYDCEFTGDGRRAKITIFDVSDRAQPKRVRELEFNGSYLSGRRLGEIVYTVLVFPEIIVPGLQYWPDTMADHLYSCRPFPFDKDEVTTLFDELRLENIARIEDASLADLLPSVRETRYEGDTPTIEERPLQDCKDVFVSTDGGGRSLLSLASFDLGHLDEDVAATSIIGKPGAVYTSRESLYIASRQYRWETDRWFYSSPEAPSEATTVHKFELFADRAGTAYIGSGIVKGRVLNQFSMDEKDGFLRIATTLGRVPSPNVHSTVSILTEKDGELIVVGDVDDIAPTEDIRSVRFHGDVGFLVTFKKTDPLFVLDLKDPRRPEIRGELKIPGFSTYMHMLDDDHILSIGYDADDQGDFAWFTGILLQIFDVSDLADPRLIHKEVIGTRGTTSDAATDHMAFNYFPARQALAIPMVVCEGGEGGSYGDRMTFSGLMVYDVDLESGFQFRGGVPHGNANPNDRGACRSWWTRSNSHVKRSVFMDDYVYSVALDRLRVSHLDDLENPVGEVVLDG